MSKVEKVAGDFLALFGVIKHEYFKPAEQITRSRLSPAQFHTLNILYRRGSLPMSELASLLKISKQQMTPLVSRLSECQLVARKLDPDDRRIIRIEITDEGRRTYQSMFCEIRRKFTEKLGLLPEERLDELEILVKRMSELLVPESHERGRK